MAATAFARAAGGAPGGRVRGAGARVVGRRRAARELERAVLVGRAGSAGAGREPAGGATGSRRAREQAHRSGSVFSTSSVGLWSGLYLLGTGELEEAGELLIEANRLQELWGSAPTATSWARGLYGRPRRAGRRRGGRAGHPGRGAGRRGGVRRRATCGAARTPSCLLGRRPGRGGARRRRPDGRARRCTSCTPTGSRGSRCGRARSGSSAAATRRSPRSRPSWSWRAAAARREPSGAACASGASSSRTSSGCARPPSCWPGRPRGSSTRGRWPRSAPPCAATATRPRRASRCARRWSWPRPARCPPLVEDVRSELYASGARPRTRRCRASESLTASERRVATLAAGGQTNREIAQALFVTPKTVEVHLSNAYRKLDIRSRRELPGALA